MSQQAGWYDDPENPDNLRYWDGVQWTNHTSPKQKPNLGRAGHVIQQEEGWGAAPGQPAGAASGRPGYGQQGYGQGQEPANPYVTGNQPSYQGQWQPMPGGQHLHAVDRAATPDGQRLAGWWHRVGARLLDGIVVAVLGALVANLVVPGVWADYIDWVLDMSDPAAVGGASTLDIPADLMGRLTTWSVVVGLFGLVYEIVLVTLLGGTVGKLITGLRVRLRDEPGNVSWGTSILRGLVYQLSGFFTPLYVINVLWPLWDDKRQALHDKPARTNVVRKR